MDIYKNKFINAYQYVIAHKLFPFAIAMLVYVIWLAGIEKIGIGILLFLAGLLLATSKDTRNPLVILLLFTYCLRTTTSIEGNVWMSAYVLLLVAGIIIHFVRFKPKLRPSKLTPALLFVLLSFILGGSTIRGFSSINFWAILLVSLFIGLIYFFFNSTIDLKGTAFAEYLCSFLLVLGFLMTIQTFSYYIMTDDALLAMRAKSIHLGWGCSNNIGSILCFTIPACAYYATKGGFKCLLAIIFTALQTIALILTFSRGAILSVVCIYPVLIIYGIIKSENKRQLALSVSSVLAVLLILALIFSRDIYYALENMISKGLDDSGRFSIYAEAWEVFKQYPVFGAGFDYKLNFSRDLIYWFHDTYLEALGKLGAVGFIAICLFNVRRYITAVKVWKYPVVAFLCFSIIAFECYSLADTSFFHPIQFIFLLMLNIAFERIIEDDEVNNIPVPELLPMQL
ncbi:MAG: O-antigen ligase family protein [Clostridia bacterium]